MGVIFDKLNFMKRLDNWSAVVRALSGAFRRSVADISRH